MNKSTGCLLDVHFRFQKRTSVNASTAFPELNGTRCLYFSLVAIMWRGKKKRLEAIECLPVCLHSVSLQTSSRVPEPPFSSTTRRGDTQLSKALPPWRLTLSRHDGQGPAPGGHEAPEGLRAQSMGNFLGPHNLQAG